MYVLLALNAISMVLDLKNKSALQTDLNCGTVLSLELALSL